jgi:hypothetical protein
MTGLRRLRCHLWKSQLLGDESQKATAPSTAAAAPASRDPEFVYQRRAALPFVPSHPSLLFICSMQCSLLYNMPTKQAYHFIFPRCFGRLS